MTDKAIKADDNWSDKLAKLVPVEVTGMFVAIQAAVESSPDLVRHDKTVILGWVIFGMVPLVPLFLKVVHSIGWASPHAIISTFTFLIWGSAICPGLFPNVTGLSPQIGQVVVTILMIAVNGVAPLFIKSEEQHA